MIASAAGAIAAFLMATPATVVSQPQPPHHPIRPVSLPPIGQGSSRVVRKVGPPYILDEPNITLLGAAAARAR